MNNFHRLLFIKFRSQILLANLKCEEAERQTLFNAGNKFIFEILKVSIISLVLFSDRYLIYLLQSEKPFQQETNK